MISSALELHRYATGRQSRVITAMTLLKSHLFRWVWGRGGVGGLSFMQGGRRSRRLLAALEACSLPY